MNNKNGSKNKYKTIESINKDKKLKTLKRNKKEYQLLPKSKICFFSKSTIEITSKQLAFITKKRNVKSNKDKINYNNKNNNRNSYNNFSNNEDYYQSSIEQENQYYNNRNNMHEESSNNYRKNDYYNYNENYNNNYLNNINSKFNNPQQKKYFNTRAFNNNMNNRLVSPNILISKNINKNRNNKNQYQKKLTDIPLSPYLLSKFNLKNPINKSNSLMNVLSNNSNKKNSNNKFPNINQNNLMKNSSSSNINIGGGGNNDINLNFFKTDTIFNYQPKNNIFIPIVSNKRMDSVKSTNTQKLRNNNLKTSEMSTPLSVQPETKLTFDIKAFHNLKKNHHEKGYGKHYGSEKECPICQSILMKNNYLMKNMNNYNDILKHKDHERIKLNKEQFLQELKKPNSRVQREEASIIRQIRQFLGTTTKKNNFLENSNDQDEENVINAYFGL